MYNFGGCAVWEMELPVYHQMSLESVTVSADHVDARSAHHVEKNWRDDVIWDGHHGVNAT
jgi:hypothetical protein